MKTLRNLAILAVLAAAVWAVTAWPRLADVETGRTPEYPDLQVKVFSTSLEKVGKAVEEVIPRLPRWTLVGVGHGPAGTSVQAVRTTPVIGLKEEIGVRISREGGKTRVSVRSRSPSLMWDFGQNARNIRELLQELDRELTLKTV